MSFSEDRSRHADLCEKIHRHNHSYYVLNQPEISDQEYDRMMRELVQLEEAWPELVTPWSPSRQVGAPVPEGAGFTKVTRQHPMLSLENTYERSDLVRFVENVCKVTDGAGDPDFVVEPKIDGISIECRYEDGRFVQALTRGDGLTGEDVTANARTVGSVPQVLSEPFTGTVRGEIFMKFNDFARVNEIRQEKGEEPFANPRNAAGGALHLLDPALVRERRLSAVFYEIVDAGEKTQWEVLMRLKALRFALPPEPMLVTGLAGILGTVDQWELARHDLEMPTDGLVIKVNLMELHKRLGQSAKYPKWAVAWKFAAERAITLLKEVSAQVGRTGQVTPVAILEPVKLSGSTVARASLHNWDYVVKKDLRTGDSVVVEKAGEIIPQVLKVDLHGARGPLAVPVREPSVCPDCETGLVRRKAGGQGKSQVALCCPNETGCPAQVVARIVHFVSRKAMNIDSLGEKLVEKLVRTKLVRTSADLYRLEPIMLLQLEGFGGKSVRQLIKSIGNSRNASLARFLYALGIPGMGEVNAQTLAAHFKNLKQVLSFATAPRDLFSDSELKNLSGLGDVLAAEILGFFDRRENMELLRDFIALGMNPVHEETRGGALTGKGFCITGTLSRSRNEVADAIREQGGTVLSGVTGKCHYLVVGENPGADKLRKLEKFNSDEKSVITRLDEAALERLLRGENP